MAQTRAGAGPVAAWGLGRRTRVAQTRSDPQETNGISGAIPASARAADQRETLVQIEPIRFDAVFTNIVLADQDRQFKADISFRGLLLDDELAGQRIDSIFST